MFHIMQILTMILVGIALTPALAHVLEFPGKMRLPRDAYMAVQGIYYPGFTIAGGSEPAALVAASMLLIFTPPDTLAFRLTLVAVIGLAGMQAVFWMVTQPINKFWLQSSNTTPGHLGERFFATNPAGPATGQNQGEVDWKKMRDRWEHSHVARAALVFLSFFCLVLAMAVQA